VSQTSEDILRSLDCDEASVFVLLFIESTNGMLTLRQFACSVCPMAWELYELFSSVSDSFHLEDYVNADTMFFSPCARAP